MPAGAPYQHQSTAPRIEVSKLLQAQFLPQFGSHFQVPDVCTALFPRHVSPHTPPASPSWKPLSLTWASTFLYRTNFEICFCLTPCFCQYSFSMSIAWQLEFVPFSVRNQFLDRASFIKIPVEGFAENVLICGFQLYWSSPNLFMIQPLFHT